MEIRPVSPPRPLPLVHRLILMFGGFSQQFGWAFFGFGMIFAWVFVFQSTLFSWHDWDDASLVAAVIENASSTSASENDSPVYRYTFRYEVGGQSYLSRSYTTGPYFSRGDTVGVLYFPDEPATSRLVEGRTAMFGWGVAFVLLFPLIGLIFILVGFRKNMKAIDLLVNGRFARGQLTSKSPTNTRINDRTVYRYTFTFTANDGREYEATGKTHRTHLLEDEETERLIYAESDPSHAVLYDNISLAPEIDPDGYFAPPGIWAYRVLILPLLSLGGHGVALFMLA